MPGGICPPGPDGKGGMEAKEGWRLILKRAEDADCTGLTNSNILIIMRLMFRFYFQINRGDKNTYML